jgi:NADH:ubiquinone oxidoreductase subunit K
MDVHLYRCISIILCQLSFFYILYKLHVSLVMLLSREVLLDFAILSFSMCCISFVGRVFGNIHCVGSVGCYKEESAPASNVVRLGIS